jgi:hypothetical protein
MSRWFRFYAAALRNPKIMRLSDKDFRLWIRLLAVASENDGHIAPAADLRMVLAMRLDHLDGGLNRLISGGLIDALADGYEPHGWSKYQYKSDVSTDRVQRFRAKRNVSETPPDTDTETEVTVAKATDASGASSFWNFAVAYLGEGRRSIIGKWRKDYGQTEVANAITAAQFANAVEPVAYIERTLRGAKATTGEIW